MRKLVHEEVDREIANKSVNIAIKMLKPELDQLMKGLREAVQGLYGYVRRYVKKIQNSRGLWFSGR